MSICSCPTKADDSGRIVRAYLDSQCEVHGQQEFDYRRKIASFCETTMRVVIKLEECVPADEGSRDTVRECAKKLRAAVMAAT